MSRCHCFQAFHALEPPQASWSRGRQSRSRKLHLPTFFKPHFPLFRTFPIFPSPKMYVYIADTTDFVDFSAWCFRKVSSKASPALRVWKHRSSGRSGDEVTKSIQRSESQTLLVTESTALCRKPSGFLDLIPLW